MFRVAQLADRPEDIPIDDAVRNRIDPMVEFHDLFQDIRRAEKGDDKRASERYFDTGLFSNPLEGEHKPKLPPAAPARGSGGQTAGLDLRAGGDFAASVASELNPQRRAMDSDLIAAALAESGLGEPSTAAAPKQQAPSVVDLDLSGEAHSGESYRGLARALGAVLVIGTCVLSFAGFLAAKNDWLFDLREVDQMLGVAFRGQDFVPRHVRVVRVVDGVETVVGEPTADALSPSTLTIGALQAGVYEASHGGRFALVDGTLRNASDSRYRRVDLLVRLLGPEGAVVAERRVPAGVRVDQPGLEAVQDEQSLDAHYEELRGRVTEFSLASGNETAFTGAFLLPPEADPQQLRFDAAVVSGERGAPTCWIPVTFGEELAASAAVEPAPDAVPNARTEP